MAYVKPGVLVAQEFTSAPAETITPLRAHISGANGLLHRYSEEDEKIDINVGVYDRLADATYPWPEKTAGSMVDTDSVKLYIEDALLLYLEDTIGDTSGGRGVTTVVSNKKNWIRNTNIAFKSNGTSYPRSAILNDRDVSIGDVAYVRGVSGEDEDCDEFELWTYVTGFAADVVDPTIYGVTYGTNNQGSIHANTTITQIAGVDNCVDATANGSSYSGLASGYITETYTIEVTKSSISGCNAARLRVTSASGTDDQEDVTPEDLGSPTDIGTRGLTVTFSDNPGNCSLSASSEGVEAAELVVGQKWEVSVTQQFEKVCAEEGTTYTGDFNDTYVVEVTKGGIWSALPEVTVTTTKGLDSSGPTVVTGANVAIPVGANGLTITFKDCGNLSSSSSSVGETNSSYGLGDDALAGLRYGDKYYITVVSGQNGPIKTLILRDDVPVDIRTAVDLDLRLFIPKTIEVTKNRLSSPPLVNYSVESTQLVVKSGITAYDSTWTKSGVEQPLQVWSGVEATTSNANVFGTMYIEYREWLSELTNTVTFVDGITNIDVIPGQLHVDNPLKWAVYRALQNSNGTKVACTAVLDTDDLDDWQDVLEQVKGRPDIYNYVPLTYNKEVHNLFQTQANDESSEENGNWKGVIVNIQAKSEKMVVGKSTTSVQALTPTSTDGDVVLATLEDNPDATGTQYTLLSVPANNSGFITYGVKPGDVVRYLYTIDSFGAVTYREFVIDSVVSENSLLLLNGFTESIDVAQKIEIWHTLNKNEIATDLVDQAQSYADTRVIVTWPDLVGTGGITQDGIFLASGIGGLISGVLPHQGLTNVEIAGFDDLASRTKDFFTSSQLDTLAEGGIWICTESIDGTPHTRHALTSDTTDLNTQEEMIRRNVDSMSYIFVNRLRPLIGRANVTPALLLKLEYEVNQVINSLVTDNFTTELGAQLISGAIALDSEGNKILRPNPLASDHVTIALDLDGPEPLNKISLNLIF